jgi:hypothetical protein
MSNKSVSEIALDDRTEIRKTLLSLLKNNRDNFHIEFEGFLSNHLSHALTALYHLGGKFGCTIEYTSVQLIMIGIIYLAPASRLHEFYDKYTKKLEPKKPSNNFINKNNWNLHTGLHQ